MTLLNKLQSALNKIYDGNIRVTLLDEEREEKRKEDEDE